MNIDVNIGARLPRDVRGRPLPPDIVQIVPQYRGYEYTVVRDEMIIEPGRREVVDVISRSGSGGMASGRIGGDRVVISSEQRETLKRTALRTTGSTQSSGLWMPIACNRRRCPKSLRVTIHSSRPTEC